MRWGQSQQRAHASRASRFVLRERSRREGGREGGRVKQFHHAMRRRRRRRRRGLPACHAPCTASALLSPLCPFIFNHLPHLCLRHRRAGQPARELASGAGRTDGRTKKSNKRRRALNAEVREGKRDAGGRAGRGAVKCRLLSFLRVTPNSRSTTD